MTGLGTGHVSASRSQNVCLGRLTHDHWGPTVCRVPREPDPDWILQGRRAIGERVRAQREYANLTQEQLAHQTGIPRLTIQRIESGATDARVGWLMRISRRLGVSLPTLLED